MIQSRTNIGWISTVVIISLLVQASCGLDPAIHDDSSEIPVKTTELNINLLAGKILWIKADDLNLNDGEPITAGLTSSAGPTFTSLVTDANDPNSYATYIKDDSEIDHHASMSFSGQLANHGYGAQLTSISEPFELFLVVKSYCDPVNRTYCMMFSDAFNTLQFGVLSPGSVKGGAAIYKSGVQADGFANLDIPIGQWSVLSLAIDHNKSEFWVGQETQGLFSVGESVITAPTIGNLFNGRMAEILMVNRRLTNEERTGVQSALMQKYALH